jgi:hypothetical protein
LTARIEEGDIALSTAVPEPLAEADDWQALTASDRKRAAYTEDLYFRECWADVLDVFGPDARALLGPLAMFAFKADGVAGRRLRPTMGFLQRHGFRVVGVAPFQHTRHSMRAVWQYDWHVYPVERLALCSVMHAATPTLLLLLVDTRYDGVVPGTMRLSELKGSAHPSERNADQLRSVLDPPNRVINFVHIADEPADVVRELGIFFDVPERRALLRQARQHVDDDLSALALAEIDRLEQRYPASDFDLGAAFARLTAAGVEPDTVQRLQAACASDATLSWAELTSLLDPADPTTDVWDFVRIGTEVLPMERPGATAGTMPSPLSADWIARAERLVVAVS